MEWVHPDPCAKQLQLGVVEISVEITGVYMRIKGDRRWLPLTYDQMYALAEHVFWDSGRADNREGWDG